MSRKRKQENRDLPPNLYLRKGIYYYRDTRTNIEYSLGKNKSLAISESIQANISIFKPKMSLLDRINNVRVITLHEWLDEYSTILEKRGLKPKTLSDYLSRIKVLKLNLADADINDISTQVIAKFIGNYDKPTMANALRKTLSDAFKEAIANGIVDSNPVSQTRTQKIKVKRSRLSLEQFNKIIEASDDKFKNIFLLAIITSQRMSDIVKMKWSDIRDNKLLVEQSKTGSKLSIPADLHLSCINVSLIDVLNNLKNNSEYVCNAAEHTIRKEFNKTITDLENKPTFHEIRSLSARLWEDQKGKKFSRKILGHKSIAMTELYLNNRNNDYIEL